MKVSASGGSGIGKDATFCSWKSEEDPSFGNYTMSVDSEASPHIVIMEGEKRRWRSGYWDGRVFTALENRDKIRFQLGYDGYERQFRWNEEEKECNVLQSELNKKCEFYNSCGSFAICDMSDSSLCKCIKGFEPKDVKSWDSGNWSKGCKRMIPLKGERGSNSFGGEDGFLVQRILKLPDFARLVSAADSKDCEAMPSDHLVWCLHHCLLVKFVTDSELLEKAETDFQWLERAGCCFLEEIQVSIKG
ncbi:putative non-specific serine/threonine protein kinase [Medicago truncatula]|nr:putative non-specific serine/threonine protein kinase [Medicago truncatula]